MSKRINPQSETLPVGVSHSVFDNLPTDDELRAENARARAASDRVKAELFGDVPPDYVPIPCTHPLETAAWRMPNGAKHVQLIDDSEATWERYCAAIVLRSVDTTRNGKTYV